MSVRRMATLLAAMLTSATIPVLAQQPTTQLDSARAQIHTTLRSFYFSLAHRDWEALAADILSAKVMASHPTPESLLAVADHAAGADGLEVCSIDPASRVQHATITLDREWARALVPRCPRGAAADEFRLIRFERRWRIIYIELRQETGALQLAR
jgi:hypothetical protein